MFSQDNTCPDLLNFTKSKILDTGLSPTMATLSSVFSYLSSCLRANPRSLAATKGISVDFFSYGYLDVSVPRVRLHALCIQTWMTATCAAGFPHSDTPGSKPARGSPGLFATCCVLHRLSTPRHPPYALSSLTTKTVVEVHWHFSSHRIYKLPVYHLAERYSIVKDRFSVLV